MLMTMRLEPLDSGVIADVRRLVLYARRRDHACELLDEIEAAMSSTLDTWRLCPFLLDPDDRIRVGRYRMIRIMFVVHERESRIRIRAIGHALEDWTRLIDQRR